MTLCKSDKLRNLFESLDMEELNSQLPGIELIVIDELKNSSPDPHFLLNQYEAEENMIALEIKRLQALKKDKEIKFDLLKTMIYDYINKNGIKRVESVAGKLSKRKTISKLSIKDLSRIPDEAWTVKREPSNTKIRELLKEGKLSTDIASLEDNYTLFRN